MNSLKPTKIILALCGLLLAGLARGQTDNSIAIQDWRRGNFPKEKDDELYQIRANGFYRFFMTNLQMNSPYILDEASGQTTLPNTLFIGDDSQLPNLLVNISGRPNKQVSWGFDIFMFQFLQGSIGASYGNQVPTSSRPPVFDPRSGTRITQNMLLNLGMNLYGTYHTQHGSFNLRLGGTQWFSMSDLTLGSFRGYNRFILYERNPWDPIGQNIGSRYNQMYEVGAVNQDQRWGERAFQGAILEGGNLPGDLSFAILYGNTELTAGFNPIPNYNYGGFIRKSFKNKGYVGINTLNNQTWLDSLNTIGAGFNMVTLEYRSQLEYFEVHAEVGAGRFNSPLNDYDWGEAITLKVRSTNKLMKLPFEVHYYRISPYVVNNNALFWNTSLADANFFNQQQSTLQQTAILTPFSSSMTDLGQMTNNRTGVNLNTEVTLGKLKMSMGYGVATEIEAFQNLLTFTHFVNQFTRSRFWRWTFPQDVGPYKRYDKIYRDAFQTVVITDDSLGVSINPKKFNQLALHGKYRTKIGYRNFYAFFLGRYNTAQPEFSLLPKFNEEAYVRQYNSELELYYQIFKPLFINSYLGYERVLGNYQTELNAETFRPMNQTGWGFGVGCDISLGRNAGLYLRHRWFSFDDSSFPRDNFKGQETLAELKVFF